MTTLAAVMLWGRRIGAVSLAPDATVASFQYDPEFVHSGIKLSPLVMPLANRVYRFPELPRQSLHGLPGLLADSLPDKFGHALIDAWLATQGRRADSFNVVERLCYIGRRGMGALEFEPGTGPQAGPGGPLRIDALVELAASVLAHRNDLQASFAEAGKADALRDILRVGTSAGGARAKAVIAWNPHTHEVRSGHVDAAAGFEDWLLKFDGVAGNRGKEFNDPQGYCAIEYAYALMARAAGIDMAECRLLEEGGRRHFMTRRFDRLPGGGKLHMQSLGALAHYDFNQAGAYSYEQALLVIRQLGLPMATIEQQFRRMLFNIVARNQDDHVKNIAFLMDRHGSWSLSPAFDVIYSYNPEGAWTSSHQMTLNGRRDHFDLYDVKACSRVAGLKRGRAETLLREVTEVVSDWPAFADQADVLPERRDQIGRSLRLHLI
jgi:serine/threonine-protein kinase HipA